VLTDEQYGRRIGDRLRHEIDDVHASPDLARELRRRRTRRTWAITGAIATPVAAAAVVAVVVSAQATPDRSTTAAPSSAASSSAQPRIVTVAYIQAETVKALGQGTQYVIYSKDTYESGYYETWTDKATQRYRTDITTRLPATARASRTGDGKMTLPSGPPAPPSGPPHRQQSHAVKGAGESQEITTVDWEDNWWSVDHLRDGKPQTPIPDPTDPDGMRKAVAEGKVELVGQEKIGTVDTHHLRVIGPRREYKIDLWVDSTTYLPVKETAVKGGNKQGGEEFPESKGEAITYTWLPRTEENLAKLTLTPPDGFKQVK
jgi:hypothetical protein